MSGRILLRAATGLLGVIAVALAAWLLARDDADRDAPQVVDLRFTESAEHALPDRPYLVHDPHAGVRPRRRWTRVRDGLRMPTDEHGLFGTAPRGRVVSGPRVLLCGDDLLAWSVADADRLGARLQAGLRAAGADTAAATVLDASCETYGLTEIALRAPVLVARYAPRLLVVGIDLGDDLAQLVDPRRAHFTPDGTLRAAAEDAPPPIPLTAQWLRGRAPAAPPELAARLLPQRALQQQNAFAGGDVPHRLDRVLEQLERAAPRGAGLLLVLLPSAADLAPEALATRLGRGSAELLDPALGARTREFVLDAIRARGLPWFDGAELLARLGADAHAADGRLSATAQRLLADELTARIAQRLAAY